jgi:hypothetical protein
MLEQPSVHLPSQEEVHWLWAAEVVYLKAPKYCTWSCLTTHSSVNILLSHDACIYITSIMLLWHERTKRFSNFVSYDTLQRTSNDLGSQLAAHFYEMSGQCCWRISKLTSTKRWQTLVRPMLYQVTPLINHAITTDTNKTQVHWAHHFSYHLIVQTWHISLTRMPYNILSIILHAILLNISQEKQGTNTSALCSETEHEKLFCS